MDEHLPATSVQSEGGCLHVWGECTIVLVVIMHVRYACKSCKQSAEYPLWGNLCEPLRLNYELGYIIHVLLIYISPFDKRTVYTFRFVVLTVPGAGVGWVTVVASSTYPQTCRCVAISTRTKAVAMESSVLLPMQSPFFPISSSNQLWPPQVCGAPLR